MNTPTDQKLLRDYAASRSEPAFAELVRRHIDLVYSAALRMVGDSHHAKDVTQGVFVALSQNARQLTGHPILSGWLHRTAQNLAANVVRANVRRQAREQEAFTMNELLATAPEITWENIAPHLDAALGELSEPDRDAVMLRYFEKKSAQEMAVLLGISDEAAQKRVSRAVERLREIFAKRGVTVGAGGLVLVIAANAVQAAPVGLAVTISAAALAGTAVATSTTIAATTKIIAMTTLQKTLVAAALVATAGVGIYEARQAANANSEVQTLQQQQTPMAEQIQELQSSFADATNRLADLVAENSRLESNPSQMEILKLRSQVALASRAASDAATKTQGIRNISEQSQMEPDYQRNQTRANLEQFFKLTNLSPQKADQYVNLEVEMKRRQDERLKALVSGTLSVDEAVRQRDHDKQEQENQRREILGPDGWTVLQSVADGMRDSAANRLTGAVQAGMINSPLTKEQTVRLQSVIKAEVAANSLDDVDLFRPVDEWTQMVWAPEQRVLQSASEFITATQLDTLRYLMAVNLKQQLQQRDQRLKALGITP